MISDNMIKVVCAIIEQDGWVLLTQRSEKMRQPLLWEFPGGKLEPGETEEQALVREIREELRISVEPYLRLQPVEHHYAGLPIELIPYCCHFTAGMIRLQEHRSYNWVPPADLQHYSWCPADLPIVEQYLQLLKNRE